MFEKINTYYVAHWRDLPLDKQFHFASRLWLWAQDPAMEQKLRAAKPWFCGDGSAQDTRRVLQEILDAQTPQFGSKNAAAERAPYFAKYPLVRQLLPLLFRLLFMETIYGIDGREELAKVVDIRDVDSCIADLLADERALAILSTHAANFLYLWHRFYRRDEAGFSVDRLFEVGQTAYDLTNKTELQLYIYLYTHCIIGESLFYKRALPADTLPLYQKMAAELDKVVTANYDNINLDNKYETLVCQQICGYRPTLLDRIDEEAARSLSANGDYLVDRHNGNPQLDNVSLDKSEHRNVLSLLAHRPFSPTDQVVG